MTQATADLPIQSKTTAASISPVSIALWLAIQLTAIVLIVTRVKLWIGGGDDSAALALMLIVQIAGAALLLPALLPNVRTTICVALAAVPFTQLAAMIAAVETRYVISGVIALTLWLIALRAAMSIARSTVMRTTLHALAMCLTIGGVVLLYLRTEFFGSAHSPDASWFGPIRAALTLVRAGSSPEQIRHAWFQLILIPVAMCALVISKRIFVVARSKRA